jgi:hypothetical protein
MTTCWAAMFDTAITRPKFYTGFDGIMETG